MQNFLTTLPVVLASIGLILATSSLISGLQLVKGITAHVEGKIHRFNGYATITIYCILAILSFVNSGIRFWALLAWTSGLLLTLLKLWIVKKSRKKRRAFKYVSWLGGTLVLMWFYLVYIHMPL